MLPNPHSKRQLLTTYYWLFTTHDTRHTSQRRDDEEASAAFARLLGDQERAFFVRTNSLPISGGDGGDRVADETIGGSPDDVFRIEARTAAPLVCDADDAHGDVVRDDSERVSRPTHIAADDVNAHDEDASNDEDASLALARALAEEEQREWRSRMLALAGVGDPADETDEGVDVDGMTYEELTELGEHIGVQSKGASAEAVASLTRFTVGESNAFGTEKKTKPNQRARRESRESRILRGVLHGLRARRRVPWHAPVRPRVPRGVSRAVARGKQVLPAVQDRD